MSAMEVDEDEVNINIQFGGSKTNPLIIQNRLTNLFTPGQVVTTEQGILKGHGTFYEDEELKSSVAGVLERVNKLIMIRPIKARFVGEIGDVVVGRITEIQQKRWKVDVNARLDAALLLSSVNLPGGELRKRGEEDEKAMRKYLKEGDLVSAEVQSIFNDDSLSLHTRSLKYGRLSHGFLASAPPSLIKRSKSHFIEIGGVSVIVGRNGYIWIQPKPSATGEGAGGFATNIDRTISNEEREGINRINCCIKALVRSRVFIHDSSLEAAFRHSQRFQLPELCNPDTMLDIALSTQSQIGII